MTNRIHRAALWLANSGIQTVSGGVRRFYREEEARYLPATTELTAYAMSALLYADRLNGTNCYQTPVQRGVRFLDSCWDQERGLMPFEPGSDYSYYFDTGMIVAALHRAGAATLAIKCAESLGKFREPAGGVAPVVRMDGKPLLTQSSRWSGVPGCYQLKPAVWGIQSGPIRLAAMIGYRNYLNLAEPDRDPTEDPRAWQVDRLHPLCYFLEGLLADPEPALLRHGIRRVADSLRRNADGLLRSDVCAQLLRIRLHCSAAELVPFDQTAASEEMDCLLRFQVESKDPRTHGGFYFGERAGQIVRHANPCSTAFALQAMGMWMEHERRTLDPDWKEII